MTLFCCGEHVVWQSLLLVAMIKSASLWLLLLSLCERLDCNLVCAGFGGGTEQGEVMVDSSQGQPAGLRAQARWLLQRL